jgi:hypothetical protein
MPLIFDQKPVAIFDLDGTLALIDHRRHFVEGSHKDWNAFFDACLDDEPNEPVIQVWHALGIAGYRRLIFSGRDDRVRQKTRTWLKTYGLEYDELRMRPHGDFTPDDELKKKWFNLMTPREQSQTHMVFDDRDKVVRMWREELGLTCFQVAPGDF